MIKRIWRHPWTVAACNILLVLALYSSLRLFCFFADRAMFPNVSFGHLLELMGGGIRFDLSAVLYLSSLYLIAILLPLPVQWRENLRYQHVLNWLFLIPNALGLAANTIDIAYIPFTDRRTTCTFFTEYSNDNNFVSIIKEGIIQYWYVALMLILVIVALSIGTRKVYGLGLPLKRHAKIKHFLLELLLFVVTAYFSVIGIRGGFGSYTRPITLSNALQYTNTPRECALVLNTPFSLMQTIAVPSYPEPKYFSEEELPEHMNPIHSTGGTEMRTDNVIVLILESFSKEYIGFYNRDIEGYQGYTPFLDSLLEQSVTFDYSYATGRKSIDAMPSVLSSIPMLIESFIVTPYSTNTLSSIADCLNRKGYYTAFFHGAPNGSMGFQAYARASGIKRYYGMNEYDGPEAFDGTWAIWDEEFLQYYARVLDTLPEPFMTAMFTASSHHPFKIPEQYKDSFPKGTKPVHEPIGYSDYSLRRFFETVSHEPWFEHTLFVITADHTNELTLPEYTNGRGQYEVPVAFYHPQMPAEKRAEVICQTDIMPSVLGFLNYDEPYFAFGEDALTKPKTHPYAVCYNATVFQIFSDSLLVQFDGEHVTGVYDYRNDRCLRANIVNTSDPKRIASMTDYLKAYIQQYTHRMIHDQLTVK